ncbi:MAG: SCP2 sterol-binding domain-containing protein [Myxococcales bacterium]|nr:SCP2 sterol-binding domain-containing protein [Myxococcales bacterium]
MEASFDISTPEELAAMLEGKSDAEVEAEIARLGLDVALDKVFDSMVERFLPERASEPGLSGAVILWRLQTPDGLRAYSMRLEAGTCTVEKGELPSPRVSLTTRIPVFLRVIAGRLNGLQAYSSGQLQVQGDQTLALLQQRFFDVDLSQAELSISTPRELARLLSGRSDAEIRAGTSVTGAERALEQVFQGMVEHYLPRKGPRRRAVVEFSIRTDEGDKLYQFSADRGGASYGKGSREKSSVRLMMSLPNFLRMVAGQLGGIEALAQGKVKVRGNILLARGVQSWFDMSR